uniref:Resolvase n=1 Tax=Escherichia coli TaxID=562 RepID=A0A7U1E0S0_ECOLX|nr:Resolvase [Escherichia coli]QQZ46750.1 Resolvase [Escherichia coli]
MHYRKKCPKKFFVIGIFLSDALLLQVIIAGTSKKTGAEIKKLSQLPRQHFPDFT